MAAANMRNTACLSSCLAVALVLGACGLTDKDPSESQFCLEVARRECSAVVGKCIVVMQGGCENVRRAACDAWVQRAKTAASACAGVV
jgi:hypothetical protein